MKNSILGKVIGSAALLGALFTQAIAAQPSGELTILNWLGGSEREMILALEKEFQKKYPDITIKDINPSAGGNDPRAGIRTSLLAGEQFDLLLNTWPSFEKELIVNGLIQPLDAAWKLHNWDQSLNQSWKNLSTHDGKTYGAYFLAGNRSGMWYRTDTLKLAGVSEPKEWSEYIASFAKLQADSKQPVFLGARSWSQTEWFENILLKTKGSEYAAKLASHQVSWTDAGVKETFKNFKQMLDANCCAKPAKMLSTGWADGADSVLKDGTSGYLLMGSWVNTRASNEYGLKPGSEYSFFQFPSIKDEYKNTMSIDGKNWLLMKQAKNPAAGALFIDFLLSEQGTEIIAQYNIASPSLHSKVDKYDPVVQKYAALLPKADVFFVLDDLLPSELSGEFRNALQQFLSDPTDATIDKVTARLEAKAQEVY